MSRPSAPLLEWLRKLLKQRGMNSAQVADQAKLPRPRVRKILSGTEPMLFDEFLAISQLLEIKPEDLGLAEGIEFPEGALTEGEKLAEAPPGPEAPPEPALDPWGNQPRQLIQAGFTLGCDFGLVLDTSKLVGSGIPASVLERYQGGPMRIQLDAMYHQYNDPSYDDEALTVTLSFDALYSCKLPWDSIGQIIFVPIPPSETRGEDPEEPKDQRPKLRLVT